MMSQNEINDSFIFDKIEEKDLKGLRYRNREFIKVWARLKGFYNIQFKYIVDEKGYANEVISSLGKDFSNLMIDVRQNIRKWNSPIDLFIYRENGSEWHTIVIVDEYEIAKKSSSNDYSKTLDYIISNLNPKIIFIALENSASYVDKLLEAYSCNTGLNIEKKLDFHRMMH